MLAGKRSDGKPIFNIKTGSDEYSPLYAKKKGKKKPIDLHARGNFQNDIIVDVRNDSYVLDSADDKTEMLMEKYGEQIFGLNDDSKKQYVPTLKKTLISVITNDISHD